MVIDRTMFHKKGNRDCNKNIQLEDLTLLRESKVMYREMIVKLTCEK